VLVPAEVAYRRNVLPLRCTDREVVVATANPFGQEARREIASLTGRPVRFELAAPDDLALAIQRAYGQAPEATDAPHLPGDTPLPRGPHVLVVDDEAGQRALFRSILEEGGCRVTVARDGSEAVSLLRGDTRFDLVTLDYWMDKMNGLRVLQQIRSDASLAAMPVIMVTGADDRRIEMSLFEAGADDYVAKPVDAPLFMLRIQAVLRRRRYA
jgi:CheY-like chemotaxis protein